MAINFNKTESVRYFLNRYNRASLQSAIEAAADEVREGLSIESGDLHNIPVDVEGIAQKMGIKIGKKLERNLTDKDGILSVRNGYLVRISQHGTPARERFTLAHEIGHVLFRDGLKHVIGVHSAVEEQAEEKICNKFAAALLMPYNRMTNVIKEIPISEPWAIITSLEKVARCFQVSLPALALRLGQVRGKAEPSLILLNLTHFPNKYTGLEPKLRVSICAGMGKLRTTCTWFNSSASGILLFSAAELFEQWERSLDEGVCSVGGKYCLNSTGKVVSALEGRLTWSAETLSMSVFELGTWEHKELPMLTSSCLYTKTGWTKDQAYIITCMKNR